MVFGPAFIINCIFLFFAGVWCYKMLGRLPHELEELWEKYLRYVSRFDGQVVMNMEKEERILLYQRQVANDFWTTLAVNVFFFWPVTLGCILYILIFGLGGLVLPLLRLATGRFLL